MKRISLILSLVFLSLTALLTGCQEDIVENVKVSLNMSVMSLDKGESQQLKAVVSPSTSNVDLKWTSSDNNIATVGSDGTVFGVSAGDAVITVTADKSTATCKVTVRPTPVQAVELDRASAEMVIGDKLVLKASVKPDDADAVVTWKSLNETVAKVSASGEVEALAAGRATIVAEAGGKIAQCMINVAAPVVNVESVKITKYTDLMIVGETFSFEAAVTPDDATDKSVVWESGNKYVIAIGNDGKAEALSEGTVEISVKTVDGGKTDKCVVIVKSPVVPVQSVTISNKEAESIALLKGQTRILKATVAPENATDKSVEWSVSDPAVLTVDNAGMVTAIGGGTAKVIVKTKDGGKTDECTFTVTVPVDKVEITAAPEGLALTAGEQFQFAAKVSPDDASDKTVNWISSETSVLTVDQTGKAVALKAGKAKVTAASADGSKSDSREITVEPGEEIVPVTGVEFDYDYVDVALGGEVALSANVLPVNATDKSLTWKSSDETVLTVKDGVVKGLKIGQATVTVTTNDGSFTDVCTVNVVVPVTGITLNATSLELEEGKQATLVATVVPENATNKSVTWRSSNPDVANVTNGVVVAMSKGEAEITANTVDGHKTATCKVTVKARYVAVESIKITAYSTNLKVGQSYQFEAKVTPTNATDDSYTWSSSNTAVLTVDQDGLVAAVAEGVADVIVKAVDGGKTDKCTVKVEPVTTAVESVKIVTAPTNNILYMGRTFKFGATVSPADAEDKTVTWSSSNPEVLAIDEEGNARTVSVGRAVITVTSKDGGKTDSREIRVLNQSIYVKEVEITSRPSNNRMTEGETFTFTAKITPDDATDKSVTWSSSDTQVLTIDQDGKATAVQSGSATVTVKTKDGGKEAKTLVTVIKQGDGTRPTKVTLNAEGDLKYVRHGKTLQLQPTYSPAGSYPLNVQWYSNDESLAVVDNNGLVKAVGFDYNKSYADYGYGEEYPEVKITHVADGVMAVYKVRIRPAVPEKIVVANPPPTSMTVGETWDFGKVTILPEEAEDRYTWYAVSGDHMQSEVGNEDKSSNVFEARSVGSWALQITATGTFASVDADYATSHNYTVNVLPIYESSIALTKTSHTIEIGQSFSLTATLKPSDVTYKDVTWTSSNSSVATVSNGIVTGKSTGTATITVKSHHGKTATCQVTVQKNSSSVAIGDYYYSDGTTSSSLQSGKTPVGVVFALVDAAGSDPKTLGADHSGCTRGRVVGLESYSTQFARSAYLEVSLEDVADNAYAAGMVDMRDYNAYNGYSNTKALRNWGEWTIVSVCSSNADKYSIPGSTSGWYVPSLGEIDLLGDAYEVVNEKLAAIDASYKIAKGAEFWCSTFFGVYTSSYTYNISGGDLAANLHQGTLSGAAQITSTSKFARFIFAF